MLSFLIPTLLLTLLIRDWRIAAVASAVFAGVLVHIEMYLEHSLNWWMVTVVTVPLGAATLSTVVSGLRRWLGRGGRAD